MEHNVVFNQNDILNPDEIATIYGEAQSEGENEKIIQTSQNSIEFPSGQKQPEPNAENNDEEPQLNQQYSRGHRRRHPQGTYKNMNEGLVAAIILDNNIETEKESEE